MEIAADRAQNILLNLMKLLADEPSKLDEDFDLFDSFLEGFKAQNLASNFYTCSEKLRLTANQYNQTRIKNKEDSVTRADLVLFSYTYVISTSTADAVGECYLTSYYIYEFII